jgi:hypothetical protein
MQVRLSLALLLCAGAAGAQPRDPYGPPQPQTYEADEPTPHDEPPTIYVPVPPPIIAPPPYVPYPPTPPPAPPQKKGGFVFRLDLSGVYRYALKDSFGGGAMRIFLGGESGHIGFGGNIDVEMGGSRGGLFYTVLDLGFGFYGVIGEYVRLGLGPQLGLLIIQRATNDDPFEDLRGVLVGLNADLTVDLVHSRHSALYLFGRVRYDFVDTGPVSDYSHGGTLQVGLGVRL